jgi:hypothetical protein
MAKKHRQLFLNGLTVGATMRDLTIDRSDYVVSYYHHGGLKAVVDLMNSLPVIVDTGGTTSFVTGATAPDWNTYITYSDANSDSTTLVIDESNVDMVTVGTFDVIWTVTDSYGDSTSLTKTITITAS